MKYIKQFGILLGITCIGEGMKYFMPFPVPGSIYGLLLLLVLLVLGVIDIEQVENAGDFLIEIMPIMFIPGAVGLITSWNQIKGLLFPLCVLIPFSTGAVMGITGKTIDFLLEKKKNSKHYHYRIRGGENE